MKDIIIIGGGGFAKEVIWLASDCNRSVLGVLDDNQNVHNTYIQGVKILGGIEGWTKYKNCEFIIAVGSPRTRSIILNKMLSKGIPVFATLIHPSVRYSNTVAIGEGSIICIGCILTVNVNIGKHNILNLNVTVGHGVEFDDFVTIAPMVAVSGNVTLKEKVEVGTGAVIRENLTLNKGSMLGMGGVLTKNIDPLAIFAGNPAKKLKEFPSL